MRLLNHIREQCRDLALLIFLIQQSNCCRNGAGSYIKRLAVFLRRRQRTSLLVKYKLIDVVHNTPVQVSNGLLHRVSLAERHFEQELTSETQPSASFELQLNCDDILKSIRTLNLLERRGNDEFQFFIHQDLYYAA